MAKKNFIQRELITIKKITWAKPTKVFSSIVISAVFAFLFGFIIWLLNVAAATWLDLFLNINF